ncbi:MAG: tetratricopeptide repeat protein [Acidobacteriota bacterium]
MKARCAALCVFVTLLGFSVYSQILPAVAPEYRQEANKYYQAQDWARAAEAYKNIVSLENANANARYRLGMSLLNLNRNAEALPQLELAFSIAPNPIFALALARAHARTGGKSKAFEVIEKSMNMGGLAPETLTSEKDFAAWKDDPGFKDLVQRSDLAVNPCKASPEFRQFDFWIGEWDVRPANGPIVASSSVQLILGQCVIFENWYPQAGSSGKSFNVFDTTDKKWHQTWFDDKGTFNHYVGGLVNGEMMITADKSAGGKSLLAKMTYSKLPSGDVRQHGENSTDDGKTWTTTFDFIYSKKKQ